MKPSPFTRMDRPDFPWFAKFTACITVETTMFVMLFAVFSETIGVMGDSYLSELPLIGSVFSVIDPDATTSHIISAILAVFSIGVPIFLWDQIFEQRILDDPQEWFSHPANKITAFLCGLILLLTIGLEVVNLYTLVAKESTQGGFTTQGGTGLMSYLAENKGLAVGVSLVIALINIIVAMLSVKVLRSFKSNQE